ncbi:hypothetical protein NDI76_14965 [Halogeometricum sp. S1BR25-6]|uniref:Uncharacterized protein n=1 Tax=Halogeometricum salsisoli TaxID=2950536 RepID=A0ABU2GGW1_9EURY|nr:hypothetical protein [Halogeometricum sp. S1BR25-6]MDS0300045.1 hypothetical protein [Halogeometricum sp. S1BR25-6]
MTLGGALGLSESHERALVRVLQAVLVGLFGYGLATVRAPLVASGAVGLAVTFLPALLRREYGYRMDAGLVVWITLSMLLHVVGFLGFYDRYQWYDEITHTLSATVVAGLGYAAFRALELHSDDIEVPSEFRAVFIVVFVLAAGVFWEVLEFALGGLVTVYGIDDIVTDMVFNGVGAILVALWGTGHVDGLVGFFGNRLRDGDDG